MLERLGASLAEHFRREEELVELLAAQRGWTDEVIAIRRQSLHDRGVLLTRIEHLSDRAIDEHADWVSECETGHRWQSLLTDLNLLADLIEQHEEQERESILWLKQALPKRDISLRRVRGGSFHKPRKGIIMKGAVILITLLVIVGVGAWQLYGQPPANGPRDPLLKSFMKQKLEHSKGVLEGLATEDYELIAKEAQALSLLSLESNWNVLTTKEYLEQSEDFRRTVNAITEAARERDVHRAALGYVNLTVRCVECHSYLRKKAAGKTID